MVNPYRFYTYAYLREDKTPYYIGKGCGKRIYEKCNREIKPPKDKSRIIFLKKNILEEEAFKHEIYMIAVFGRIDLGTGILRNKTDGGEGASGVVVSEENRRKMTDYLQTLIDREFTPSEQEAILVQMVDAVGDGRKYEFYRELRNGKNVLMVRHQKK